MKRIVILFTFLVFLTGCANKISNKEVCPYDYKTKFIGDNSNVVEIVNSLKYEEGFEVKDIELKTDYSPYTLIVNANANKEITREDLLFPMTITFSLIDNMDVLIYKIGEDEIKFTRDDAKTYANDEIGVPLDVIGSSEENFKKVYNKKN